MSRHPAGTINIGGARFDVDVDDEGNWYAYTDNGNRALDAPTKADLRKKLVRATKTSRAQVAVEFTLLSSYARQSARGRTRPRPIEARHGTATGLHSSNGNVLVRWDNGETEQATYWYDQMPVTRLSDDEVVTWRGLYQAAQAAEISLESFLAEHAIDLPKATRAAIDAAISGDDEGDGDD